MELINPKVELIKESDPYRKIELAARTCYKSEANITDESAKKLVANLIQNKHTAMLEHAHLVFETTSVEMFELCQKMKYLNCTKTRRGDLYGVWAQTRMLISGNIRAINESGITPLIEALHEVYPELAYTAPNDCGIDEVFEDWSKPKVFHLVSLSDMEPWTPREFEPHTYITMRFTCDRGVSHELVRHRVFSFAQESTRYVNYTKGQMQFIKPADFDNWNEAKQHVFNTAMAKAEEAYNAMIAAGSPPQEARAMLPNAIKTEVVVSGNMEQWKHFYNLRYHGTTGKPHPDMKIVADQAYKLYLYGDEPTRTTCQG